MSDEIGMPLQNIDRHNCCSPRCRCSAAPAGAAQTVSSPLAQADLAVRRMPRYARRRIEIYPGRLLYRRCIDWYELQNRPSGTVLYPQMRCWWVRG